MIGKLKNYPYINYHQQTEKHYNEENIYHSRDWHQPQWRC